VRVLWALIASLAVLGVSPRPSLAQEIKISHQWAERIDGRDRAVRVFVQEVGARTTGLKFRIYPDSSLQIRPADLFAALKSSKVEMAVYPLTYAVGQVPEFSLAGLPGLVPDLDAAQALKNSEMHAMLQSLAQAHGIRILTWWWAPGGFFAKEFQVFGPASVRGLKMRAADPLFELMLKEAGASIASMPSTDLYSAMKLGELDAIATTYEAFMSLRLSEQAKFATLGSSLFMGFCPLVMSLATWNGLTPEQRMAIAEAADIADTYFDSVERDLTRRMEQMLRNNSVAIWRMSQDDYLAWLQLAQQTAWQEYAKTNPRAQDLLLKTVRTFLGRLDNEDNTGSAASDGAKN
jgi:TRAP-type transport system periplasmic protein